MAKLIFWIGHIVLIGYGAYMYIVYIAPENEAFWKPYIGTAYKATDGSIQYYHAQPFWYHLDQLSDGGTFQSVFFIWVIWLIAHLVVSSVTRKKRGRDIDL